MKKIVRFMCAAVVAGTFVSAAAAFAEDPKPAAISADDLKKALGMSLYFQGGYTYNANASTGDFNDLRVFDKKANSFMLDLAEIVFAKDPTASAIGYKVKISAGETAKYIHSAGMVSSAGDDPFDITEAYMSYTAPVGKGLRIDFGKFVTYHGAEVIEAIDNPNYSRSFLFNYAIPFTHTGVKAGYTFSDTVSASLHIVNGWDNSTDNNSGKTLGLSIGLTPSEKISGYINYMTGPEKNDNTRDNRSLLDLVATIKPIKPLSFILNYDYGQEDHSTLSGGTATWSGIAGIVKYDFSDTYSLAVRGEYFDDQDGVRTLTAQKLTEITVTPEIRTASGLILRPEYRHDSSDKSSFDNSTKKSQDTVALGAMYRW
jgi:hypothetical protein